MCVRGRKGAVYCAQVSYLPYLISTEFWLLRFPSIWLWLAEQPDLFFSLPFSPYCVHLMHAALLSLQWNLKGSFQDFSISLPWSLGTHERQNKKRVVEIDYHGYSFPLRIMLSVKMCHLQAQTEIKLEQFSQTWYITSRTVFKGYVIFSMTSKLTSTCRRQYIVTLFLSWHNTKVNLTCFWLLGSQRRFRVSIGNNTEVITSNMTQSNISIGLCFSGDLTNVNPIFTLGLAPFWSPPTLFSS